MEYKILNKYCCPFVVYFQIKIYGDVRERRLRSFKTNVGKMAKSSVKILTMEKSSAEKVKLLFNLVPLKCIYAIMSFVYPSVCLCVKSVTLFISHNFVCEHIF